MKIKLYLLFFGILAAFCAECQVDTSEFSFYNVYTKIFDMKCAIPACHDGSFEPDFRTIESAYYTLVFHPIIKNNANKTYAYRIVPKSPNSSVLYKRITTCCFVNTNDRMPLTILQKGDTLSSQEINLVRKWIEGGAKDICGKDPKISVTPIVIDPDFNSYIHDSVCISNADNRLEKNAGGSFVIHAKDTLLRLEFKITTSGIGRSKLLSNALVRITDSVNNFSSAQVIKLKIQNNRLVAYIKPPDFKSGRIYYMRVELMDEKAKHTIYYPASDANNYSKLNWSFYIEE